MAWEDLFRSPNTTTSDASGNDNGNGKAAGTSKVKGTAKKGPKMTTKHSVAAAGTSGDTTTTTATKNPLPPAVKPEEVFRGPPNDDMEGGWPSGWIKTEVIRKSGQYAGARDRYWHSPGGKKMRSLVEVKKFMALLAEANNDETIAWKAFKTSKKE